MGPRSRVCLDYDLMALLNNPALLRPALPCKVSLLIFYHNKNYTFKTSGLLQSDYPQHPLQYDSGYIITLITGFCYQHRGKNRSTALIVSHGLQLVGQPRNSTQ